MALVEILQQYALISIVGISAIISLASTLVYKYATDQSLIKALREEAKKIQEELKNAKNDQQKTAELQNKLVPINLKLMSQTLRPSIITIIPFILIFALLSKIYNSMVIIPLPFWKGHLGWIGTYIIFSMIFSTAFRKILKVA
ncbi:MAG: EMC3/TMCO1 family protein [Candidatus Nanoarchaeia archaeon]